MWATSDKTDASNGLSRFRFLFLFTRNARPVIVFLLTAVVVEDAPTVGFRTTQSASALHERVESNRPWFLAGFSSDLQRSARSRKVGTSPCAIPESRGALIHRIRQIRVGVQNRLPQAMPTQSSSAMTAVCMVSYGVREAWKG